MIATSSLNKVTLWDMISLQKIIDFKAGESVNCLYMIDDYLISGGKGTPSANSLHIWDIRKDE